MSTAETLTEAIGKILRCAERDTAKALTQNRQGAHYHTARADAFFEAVRILKAIRQNLSAASPESIPEISRGCASTGGAASLFLSEANLGVLPKAATPKT